jgi:steroid delta-isomerase-like uncharacterized protein
MTHDEIRDFFAEQQRHWHARDAARLGLGHAENGTVESPIFRTVTGRANIIASYEKLFEIFPDWSVETETPLIDGDRVAQPFNVRATHKGEFMGLAGSGKQFEIHGVRIFTMRDGLIALERRVYDFTGLLIQIGVLKGKPGY